MPERRRWFQFRPLPVENSIPLRLWTLAVVLIGVLAILNEEEWPSFGWLVVGLTIVGSVQSYYRRSQPNWVLKIVIVGCMFWAMYSFWADLWTSANDPRIPLATLLMWLQTLHAYDLPYRHNLNVSFFVGVVLMAVAAVLSTTAAYAGFLLAFVVAGMLMLQHSYLSWRAEIEARSGMPSEIRTAPVTALPQVRTAAMARRLPVWLALLVAGSGIVYLCVPHLSGLRIRTLPISMVRAFPHMGAGTIVNPAFPGGVNSQTAAKGGKVFDPDAYSGFNSYMDLTVRGELSHEVVMRVRTSRPTYYRALAFDHYDGRGWQVTNEDHLEKVTAAQPPVQIGTGRFYGQEDLVQIFYLDHDMSNVIMGAYHVSQVYFNGDTLYVDRNDGVRADFALSAGTTYSVVSRISPNIPEKRLAKLDASKDRTHQDWTPYLQLPDNLPAGVRDLALEVTYPYRDKSTYLKAAAIAGYLRNHYTYSVTTPPPPPNEDATDQFLFRTRAGSCEQFATAMAVLCRAVGVPARMVVGYLPGSFNPFSGVYEVHASEAHAWVEIGLPVYGWISIDPTPGWGVLPGTGEVRSHWVLGALLDYLATNVKVPEGVRRVIGGLQERWARLDLGHALWAILVACGIMSLVWLTHQATRAQWTRMRRRRALPAAEVPYREVQQEYRHMLNLLRRHGYLKKPGQTPSEFAATVPFDAVAVMTKSFEQYRYGPVSKASSEALAALRQDLSRLKETLENR